MKFEIDRTGRVTVSPNASLFAGFLALCGCGMIVDDSIRAAIATGRTIDAVRIARTRRGLSFTEAKNPVDEVTAESRRPKA